MESNNMDNNQRIRIQCLTKMEEHYAKRIEELIDEMRLEDAESLCHEMSFEGEEGTEFYDDSDLFLDDLTDWLDQPFPGTGINFYDKDISTDDDFQDKSRWTDK